MDETDKFLEVKKKYPWPSHRPNVMPDSHSLFVNEEVLKKIVSPECKVIVELGSWLGASTRFFLQQFPHATVFAVDHWKGSLEHQNKDYAKDRLGTLYETFLVNCWNYKDRLVPVKETTLKGLEIINQYEIKPDLAYVDASHGYEDVTGDLEKILELFPYVQIIGDDWLWGEDIQYPVRRAAIDFSEKYNFKLYYQGNCWWLKSK